MAIKTYVKFDQIEDFKFFNIIKEIENMKAEEFRKIKQEKKN